MSVVEVAIGWTDIAAATVLVGGSAYAALVETPQASGRRCLRSAASVLAAALVLEITVNSLRMHRLLGMGGATLLADVLEMKWTRWWALRSVALAALAIGLRAARPRWSLLAGIGTVSLLARSLQGHAGAHGILPALIDWAHLSAATVWVGGLVQLALLPTIPPAVALRASTDVHAGALPAGRRRSLWISSPRRGDRAAGRHALRSSAAGEDHACRRGDHARGDESLPPRSVVGAREGGCERAAARREGGSRRARRRLVAERSCSAACRCRTRWLREPPRSQLHRIRWQFLGSRRASPLTTWPRSSR